MERSCLFFYFNIVRLLNNSKDKQLEINNTIGNPFLMQILTHS